MYKVDQNIADDLICEPVNGGLCKLKASCESYPNLWIEGWTFKIQFQGQDDYILFPIGALAVDNADNVCELQIQFLDVGLNAESNNVIFGTMFLQMYATYFEYDLTANTTTLNMYVSDSCTLYNVYMGTAAIAEAADPFTLLWGQSQEIYVNHDQYHYKTTIGAQLGFQGNTQMQVSLLGQFVQTWQKDCLYKHPGLRFTSCDQSPILANLYFDQTPYFNASVNLAEMGDYAGYNYSGYMYNASVCARTVNTDYFCTSGDEEFLAADSVYDDNWNYDSNAGSGTFGLGRNSPIWKIFGSPASMLFDVYLSNFNSWNLWAYPNYTPATTNSVINFGGFSSDYGVDDVYTRIYPY